MDISIIIVSYNSANHLPELLTSIKKSKDGLKKEVIIVDNASADNSVNIAKSHPLKPKVVASKNNQGFSKGVNQGLNKASGEYIFLLNPDTRVVGNCIRTLYDFAVKSSPLGAVVPKLLDINGKQQPSVYKFPTIWNAIKKDFFFSKKSFGKYLPENKLQKVEVAVMAAFMMPRSTIKKVGGLDERFFLYYEDVEFCRRLKKFGLPIYYLPTA